MWIPHSSLTIVLCLFFPWEPSFWKECFTLMVFASLSSMSSVCCSTHQSLVSATIPLKKLLSLKSTLSCSSISLVSGTLLSPTFLTALSQVSGWAPHLPPSPYVEELPRVPCLYLFSPYTPCFADLSFHVMAATSTGLCSVAPKFFPSWNLRIWPYLEVGPLLLY